MIVVWSEDAADDLAALRRWIEVDNPVAARRMVLAIAKAVHTLLPAHPGLGRPGRIPGTRELVIKNTPYIVPYRISGEVIQVLRVYHAARKWPDTL